MTTATSPRIITTHDHGYSIVADSTVMVLTGKHDYTPKRSVSILASEGELSISVADASDHATFWMNTEEARLFAQAILDATA
jgi:hypothetical protein